MKNILFLIFTSLSLLASAQLESQQLIRVHNVSNLSVLNAISSPLSGQMVFVDDEKTIYQYDGVIWKSLTSDFELVDSDGDTRVEVDDGNDNDIIRFTSAGQTYFEIDGALLQTLNNNESTFIGNTGVASTKSVLIGESVLLSADASNTETVAIGYRSMELGINGQGNTAVGAYALRLANGGDFNIGLGYRTLHSNIDFYNTAVGASALYSNVGGTGNTSLGYQSLMENVSGNYNVALGFEALHDNTTGSENIALGTSSLELNTTGEFNIAIGGNSLQSNTSGINNIAIGRLSLSSNTTGNENIAIGRVSLENNTTGYNNLAIGRESLRTNTTGSANVALGFDAIFNNSTGSANVALGFDALYENATGSFNVAVGSNALIGATNASNNIGIGAFAVVPDLSGNNQVRIGNEFITYAGIQVPWTITSDLHWKDSVQSLSYGLDLINHLRPVSYLRKGVFEKKREIGFIAQELDVALRKVGYYDQGFLTKTDKGLFEVRYNDFIGIAINAIKQQQQIIDSQQNEMLEIKKRLTFLEDKIDRIK